MSRNNQRRAFTLVELLVVIAIVALMVVLLLPAINDNRGTHRGLKHSCRNNVKQLALGLQNHHDTYKTFPPLYFSSVAEHKANPELNPAKAGEYYTWQTRVLPFIEEDTLYKGISASSKKFTLPSTKITVAAANGQTSPKNVKLASQLYCPELRDNQPDGNCNYVALSATRLPLLTNVVTDLGGMTIYKKHPDGMIIPDKKMRGYSLARMSDGTSKTAVFIESREALRSNWYEPPQSFVVGFLPADSTPIDAAAREYYPYFKSGEGKAGWQFNPAAGNRTALNFGPTDKQPNAAYHGIAGDPLERTWGPSSAHEGGVINVGMGDGSVQEIKSDIDPMVLFALITVRGEYSPTAPQDPMP